MAIVAFQFGPTTKSYTRSAQSLTRLQAYVNAAYATIPDPLYPSVGHTSPTMANPDPTQSFCDALLAGIVANVKRFEDEAAKAAIVPAGDLT